MSLKREKSKALASASVQYAKVDVLAHDVGMVKSNFERSPAIFDCARDLIDFCLSTRMSVSSLGVAKAKLDLAMGNPDVSSYVRARLGDDLKTVYEEYRQTRNAANIQVDLELSESLARINRDPDAQTLGFLFLCKALIHRNREALECLLGAARKDLASFGPSYIKYCFDLHEEYWYKKAVEFYEAHKEALDSILDDKGKTHVAIAYDRLASIQSEGFTRQYEPSSEGVNQYIQTKGLLTRAHAVYHAIYEKTLKGLNEGLPLTEENAHHLTNYAVNLYQLAMLSDRNAHIEHFSVHLKSPYRNESVLILEDLIRRVDQMPSPSDALRRKQRIAKANLVYSSASDDLGVDINEKALAIAKELKDDPEIRELGGYSNFLNYYGVHLGIRRRRLNSDDFSEEEKVLKEAFLTDWKNPRIYLALANLYKEKGDSGSADRYLAFRSLVQIWIEMRQVLRFEAGTTQDRDRYGNQKASERNPASQVAQIDKALRLFLRESLGQGATCERLFKPLKKTAKVYGKKVRKWAKSTGLDINDVSVYPKSSYSILLKLLREKKKNATEISNLLTMRVEADSADEARRLGQKIKDRLEVVDEAERFCELDPRILRSLDIVGRIPGDPLTFLVRVTPREDGSTIERGKAEHENRKLSAIASLEAEIAKDPQANLQFFHDILIKLGKANICFMHAKRGFRPEEVLSVYDDPDGFMERLKK